MNFEKLEKNIIDVIKEEQLKLGYLSEIIRLFYPLSSLNRFLGTELDVDGMVRALEAFVEHAKDKLGEIEVFNTGDRFGLKIPPQGADYVHSILREDEFIARFVKTIGRHGCSMEEVFEVFRSESEMVHIEKVDNGEFDYLIYFENGKPDDYRYCVTDEGCHVIYHRYTPDDYIEFGF